MVHSSIFVKNFLVDHLSYLTLSFLFCLLFTLSVLWPKLMLMQKGTLQKSESYTCSIESSLDCSI